MKEVTSTGQAIDDKFASGNNDGLLADGALAVAHYNIVISRSELGKIFIGARQDKPDIFLSIGNLGGCHVKLSLNANKGSFQRELVSIWKDKLALNVKKTTSQVKSVIQKVHLVALSTRNEHFFRMTGGVRKRRRPWQARLVWFFHTAVAIQSREITSRQLALS